MPPPGTEAVPRSILAEVPPSGGPAAREDDNRPAPGGDARRESERLMGIFTYIQRFH